MQGNVDIRVRGVVKKYGNRAGNAVDHIDLDVRSGEFLGLLGPNGAGKTTVTECGLAHEWRVRIFLFSESCMVWVPLRSVSEVIICWNELACLPARMNALGHGAAECNGD